MSLLYLSGALWPYPKRPAGGICCRRRWASPARASTQGTLDKMMMQC